MVVCAAKDANRRQHCTDRKFDTGFRDRVASNSRELSSGFLYSVTVSVTKEEHILLAHYQTSANSGCFMTQRVAHDGLLDHYFNKFEPTVSRSASRTRKVGLACDSSEF